MKKLLATALLLQLSLTFAVEQYPIPTDIQDFYKDLIKDYNTNCAHSQIAEDSVIGPYLYVTFVREDKSSEPSHELLFKDLFLFNTQFNPEFKITSNGEFETLSLVIYQDACVYLPPAGKSCVPMGVRRNSITIVKNTTTDKIIEALRRVSVRRINRLTGNLKKTWDESGLFQYDCKNGVFSEKIQH